MIYWYDLPSSKKTQVLALSNKPVGIFCLYLKRITWSIGKQLVGLQRQSTHQTPSPSRVLPPISEPRPLEGAGCRGFPKCPYCADVTDRNNPNNVSGLRVAECRITQESRPFKGENTCKMNCLLLKKRNLHLFPGSHLSLGVVLRSCYMTILMMDERQWGLIVLWFLYWTLHVKHVQWTFHFMIIDENVIYMFHSVYSTKPLDFLYTLYLCDKLEREKKRGYFL